MVEVFITAGTLASIERDDGVDLDRAFSPV